MSGMGPLALARLLGDRLIGQARWMVDGRGGLARVERRERRRIAAALIQAGGMEPWLHRKGAGRLWLESDTAARWARARCSAADLAAAQATVQGTVSLLGVEDAPLGDPPQWRRDLYSGREWPLAPAPKVPLFRGDGSDIRTVWELSRCYHFIWLAKAYWRTGDQEYLETFRRHVESWLADNPPGRGPNWRSPMDAAVRVGNWALATVLFAPAPGLSDQFWTSVLANLRTTARFVERHLEWHPVYRGNHYLANAVGLVYVGALFQDDGVGSRWLRRGARILAEDIRYQVHPDGVSFEAALGYHRLDTELLTYAGLICERNDPRLLPADYWTRLRAMYAFLDAYLPTRTGEAPLLGDADDGRLHLLCAEALRRPREHRLGLPARFWPTSPPVSRAFEEGGFYVLRRGPGHCVVRCGPVGLRGAGSHDHNDQLAYELRLGGQAVISDSGTFTYTRSLLDRFAFRCTAAHSVVQVGGEEQNVIRADRPWRVFGDRTRARCTEWTVDPALVRFVGEHAGFAHRSSHAVCRRRITVRDEGRNWSIEDEIEGLGSEELVWRAHFAPGSLRVVGLDVRRWRLEHDGLSHLEMALESDAGLDLAVETSAWSPRYGVASPRPVVVLRGTAALPARFCLRIVQPAAQSSGSRP